MFSTLFKTNFNFSVTIFFVVCKINAFNLDQSTILSFGKKINNKTIDLQFERICRRQMYAFQSTEFACEMVENNVGNEEKHGYKYFLLYKMFSIAFILMVVFPHMKKTRGQRWPWIAHLNFEKAIANMFFVTFREEFT